MARFSFDRRLERRDLKELVDLLRQHVALNQIGRGITALKRWIASVQWPEPIQRFWFDRGLNWRDLKEQIDAFRQDFSSIDIGARITRAKRWILSIRWPRTRQDFDRIRHFGVRVWGAVPPLLERLDLSYLRRAATFVFAVIAVWFGILGLAQNARQNDLTIIANTIQSEDDLDASFITNVQTALRWATATGSCASDEQGLIVELQLSVLDYYYQNLAFDGLDDLSAVDDQLDSALVSLERAASCLPVDGDIWIQQAMVSVEADGPSEAVIAAVEQSYLLAPYESWTAIVRAEFAAQFLALYPNTQPLETILANDVSTLAGAGLNDDLSAVLNIGGSATYNSFRSAKGVLPEDSAFGLERMIAFHRLTEKLLDPTAFPDMTITGSIPQTVRPSRELK